MKLSALFLFSLSVFAQSVVPPPSGGGGSSGQYSTASTTYAAGTYYFPAGGGLAANATQANVYTYQGAPGAISAFSASSLAPSTATLTFTWYDGTTAEPVTCAITSTATSCQDLTHTFTYAVNDPLTVKMVVSGASYTGTVSMVWGTGQQGPPGSPATVAVGTTSTLSPGASATVTNTGTASAVILDFGIPQGPAGSNGTNGTNGSNGTNGTNGTNGAAGAGYAATSTSSATIGTGSQTLSLVPSSGLAYSAGARARFTCTTNTSNYMEGLVTSYSAPNLTILADTTGGSGTCATWNINIAGNPGSGGSGSGNATFATGTFSSCTSCGFTHNLNTLYPIVTLYDATGCVIGSTGAGPGAGGTCVSTTVSAAQNNGLNAWSFTLSNSTSGNWSAIGPGNGPLNTPTFSPNGGTFSSTQSVTISAVQSATICYNTTGTPSASVPGTCDAGSTTYSGPVSVASSETLYAIATEANNTNSAIGSAVFVIQPTLTAPTFSPNGGTFASTQSVTITAGSGATICYNTTGAPTAPTAGTCGSGSTTYSGAISVSVSETLYAIATKASNTNSSVSNAAFVINSTLAPPTFSPAAGTYSTSQSVTISASAGATICYNTTGSPGATTPGTCNAGSTTYSAPVTVSTTSTLYAIATEATFTNSSVASAAYNIYPALSNPTFSPGSGSYSGSQSVTITFPGGSTGCYATTSLAQGAILGACGSGWTTYSTAVTVSSSETLYAYATEAAMTNSSTVSAAYTITGMSVINSTQGWANSTSATAGNALTLAAGDQLVGTVYWALDGTCAAAGITLSDGNSDTFVTQGPLVENEWTGTQCEQSYSVLNTNAGSSLTISLTTTNANAAVGFEFLQIRGSSNATADQTGCNNTSGPPGTSMVVPASSGAASPCSNGTITTTHSSAMVVATVSNPTAGGTYSATSSACFGVTPTLPANGQSTEGALVYTLLSGTQTGTCGITWSNTTTFTGKILTYH